MIHHITGTPLVSIVMGVYNGDRYVSEAVESILAQTFTDFEFIIVDDGSTDNTTSILSHFGDSRLNIVHQSNIGLTRSLNRGIALARGELIARMDADDVSRPQRLIQQVAFLDTHPAAVVAGSAYRQVDMLRDRASNIVPPLQDADIRRALVSGNPLCHSSVLMRRAALEQVGFYDERFRYSQDYELWSRLAQAGELRNLPQVLVTRRYHVGSVSNNLRTELLRLGLFWQASNLAIDRLGFPGYLRFLPLRTMTLILAADLYAAARIRWRGRRSG